MTLKERAVKAIKGLFNFEHPDSNVLVQHVKCGYWVRIYPGYKGVVSHRSGYVSVHNSGFMFVPPLATGDIIADHSLPISFKYEDTKITLDNVTVEAKESISYEYRLLQGDYPAERVVKEPNVERVVQNCVKDIVALIVTNSFSDDIKHGFTVSRTRIPTWLDSSAKRELNAIFDTIQSYGCDIDSIHICDFNEPEAIRNAETARKQMRIELETEKERAERERDIEVYRAHTQNRILSYHYKMLAWVAETNNLTPEQTFQLIRADLLKESNVVNVIGGNGQIDSLAAAIFARYQQLGLMDKQNQTGAGEVIEAGYSDDGRSRGSRN